MPKAKQSKSTSKCKEPKAENLVGKSRLQIPLTDLVKRMNKTSGTQFPSVDKCNEDLNSVFGTPSRLSFGKDLTNFFPSKPPAENQQINENSARDRCIADGFCRFYFRQPKIPLKICDDFCDFCPAFMLVAGRLQNQANGIRD